MKKWLKIVLPIICVLVVVVTFVLLFDMKGKTEQTSAENNVNTANIISNTNTNTNTNENTNTNTNAVVENNSVENTTTVSENTVEDAVMSGKDDRYAEDKQEKAIELVKKKWGEDDTVYFTNESVNSDEEYIVAVRQKSSTAVKNYFKVNIKTGVVTIDY